MPPPFPQPPQPPSVLSRLGVACMVIGAVQAVVGVVANAALHTGGTGVATGIISALVGAGMLAWDRWHDDGPGSGGGGGGGRRRRELAYIPVENRPRYPGRHL